MPDLPSNTLPNWGYWVLDSLYSVNRGLHHVFLTTGVWGFSTLELTQERSCLSLHGLLSGLEKRESVTGKSMTFLRGLPANPLYRRRPFKLIPPWKPYPAHCCRLHGASQWLVNSSKLLHDPSALTEGYTLAELLFFCLPSTSEGRSTKCRAGSC